MKTQQNITFENKLLWVIFIVGLVLSLSGLLTYKKIKYLFDFCVSAYDVGELAKASINEQVSFALLNVSYYVIPDTLIMMGISCWLIGACILLVNQVSLFARKIRNRNKVDNTEHFTALLVRDEATGKLVTTNIIKVNSSNNHNKENIGGDDEI